MENLPSKIEEYAMTVEEWEQLKDFPNYGILSEGRVMRWQPGRRTHKGKILKPFQDTSGYLLVSLFKNNKRYDRPIHRLVAKEFCLPINGQEINHIDGNKLNNRADNLEWVSRSDNVKHMFRIGLRSNRGELNPKAKLTMDEVNKIRRSLAFGNSYQSLANKFKVSKSCIAFIAQGKSWR